MKVRIYIIAVLLALAPTAGAQQSGSNAKRVKKAAPAGKRRVQPRKQAPKVGISESAPAASSDSDELSGSESSAAPSSSSSISTPRPRRSGMRPNKSGWRFAYQLWQEDIKLKNDIAEAHMNSQFQGIALSMVWDRPYRGPRWSAVYTADLGAGKIKGKGDTAALPDNFANQTYFTLGGSAGFHYRTTAVSGITFYAPVNIRMITWRLASSSTTDPDKDFSFSFGYGMLYSATMSARTNVLFGFTHQHLWQGTQWNIALQVMSP